MHNFDRTEPAPTLDEVWRSFRELSLLLKEQAQEAERRSQEAERRSQEAERRSQEFDRQLQRQAQEAERRSQEFDRQLQQQAQEAERRSQEAERRSQELDRLLKEQSRETDKKIGKLGNRLGDFVEGFVAPAAVRLFRERGIEVRSLSRDVETENPELGLATQIDLLVKNGDCCILIEVKSHLSVDDVNEHLERMGKFKPLFPEYANKKVYGAVAAMVIPAEVGRYAYRKGFFVIGQTGEAMKILNDEKFTPTAW